MTEGGTQQSRAERPSREEKLAAKLRENLKRRKAQARAMAAGEPAEPPALHNGESNR